MGDNRLMTDDELFQLPDGAMVYIEVKSGGDCDSAEHEKGGCRLYDDDGWYYDLVEDGPGGWRNRPNEPEGARAWLRKPTEAELAVNPW